MTNKCLRLQHYAAPKNTNQAGSDSVTSTTSVHDNPHKHAIQNVHNDRQSSYNIFYKQINPAETTRSKKQRI